MAVSVSDEQVGRAVLENVESGVYQPSAELAEVQLLPTAVPVLLSGIGDVRERVKDEIRSLSKQAAPDIEGWIARAKQIQQDIERSKATAHDIVKQAEAVRKSQHHVEDTASKVALLEKELVFNETLAHTVGQIHAITETLRHAQDAVVHKQIIKALDRLTEASNAILHLSTFENTRIVGVLRKKADQLKRAIVDSVAESWNALIYVEGSTKRITIKDKIQEDSDTVTIDDIVDALTKLNTLDATITRLSRDIDYAIISARLRNDRSHSPMEIHIVENVISASGRVKDLRVREVLLDMNSITKYLSSTLPRSVAVPLSGKLMPPVISRLTTEWLNPSLPLSLETLQNFQQTATMVRNFANSLDQLGWEGKKQLLKWVDNVPYAWLQKQREAALYEVRQLCLKGIQSKHVVERVETQVVSGSDTILQDPTKGLAQQDDEGWGAEWDAEESEAPDLATETPSKAESKDQPNEDDDADAWGWNEEEEAPEEPPAHVQEKEKDEKEDKIQGGEDDADAWGWGEEEETTAPSRPAAAPTPAPIITLAKSATPASAINGAQQKSSHTQRELTLKETYTVTAIPDSLLGMILQNISDMERLSGATYSGLDVGTAAGQLSSIPSLILAMYRATAAATHYANDVAGNMLVYNDCMRIVDQLRSILDAQVQKDQNKAPEALRPSALLYLENDIKAISAFGKRAYGAEMESQRTIIRDLLDGAQGFVHCTVHPFSGECDNAIAMTLDRLRELHGNWEGILSHSALLQSMGSILAAAVGKMITDIEDMSDISEQESQRLRQFCLEMGKISDLFVSKDPSQLSGDLTGIYTPNWFKFQYLSEILDSSLADIKYLWTDGELRLEFEADEVIDLINALFAESEHRRKALGEIRRTANR